MPRITIAQRLALLAVAVALVMTIAICLLSFLKGRAVLTEHEVVNLADDCNLRMFELREEFRYIAREVRDTAARLPKPPTGQPLPEFAKTEQFKDATDKALYHLLDWAERHGETSPSNWVDRDIFEEVIVLGTNSTGQSTRLANVVWSTTPGGTAKTVRHLNSTGSSAFEPALVDIEKQIRDVARTPRPGQPRQFTSGIHPVRDDSSRRTLCIAYESPLGDKSSSVFVLAIDFTRMVANQARHSPRHLLFITDKDGTFLAHPNPFKVGTRIQDDQGPDGKARFDFQQVSWGTTGRADVESDLGRGESQLTVRFDEDLRYLFSRKAYPTRLPFRNEEQRAALSKELEQLADQGARFRFSRPRANSREMALTGSSPQIIKEAQQVIARFEKEASYKGGRDWEGPVECSTFAAHVVPFRIGMERAGAETAGEPLHLIVAASLEEIAQDISEATRWVWWVSLLLCGVAGVLALFPAHLLTRPLARITRAAQRLAEGDYTTDLPVQKTNEIGDLARAFRHMEEQIQQRDQALRDTLARMQAVLRSAADGIITFNERGIIEEWNHAAERIFGYAADEIMGGRVQQLMEIPPQLAGPAESDPATGTVQALNKVIGSPSEIRQGRRRDGSTFWMEVAFSAVPVGDRRLITGIFRDVTRRVEDEERIRHMNELLEARVRLRTAELQDAKSKLEVALQSAQAASQAKDVFVRTISHELRTPLSAVKGFTELLLNPKAAKLRDNPIPTLQKIHSASEYLLTLINDLLDVARYTAGEQIHLTVSEFDLPRFFSGIVEMTNPLVKKNGNRLVAEAAPDLGRMRADETRVRQVLLNLLSNAGKFTENGEITFKARREQITAGDWLEFTVADTGNGMTDEQMKGLFKPFYRVDNSITRKHGGTGLGLSISKLLCERMGGTISVTSAPGLGTSFVVRLPAAVPETAAPAAASLERPVAPHLAPDPDSGPLQRDTVLVIDDDVMSREMVQSFLSREGFQVYLAATGDDGLRLAREKRPSAITLDVLMPDSDGWAVLSALKSDPHTRDIPVIMLTVAEDRTRGFTLGAADYVTKPIDWNRLGEILHKYCSAPESILVVEDDQLQRESLSQALTLSGWLVREAKDGCEALNVLAAERPAVILLDLLMPNMDGFQFLEELRRRPDGDTIPVIVVTAKDLDDEDRRRLNGGVARILHKGSVSREELLARIRTEVCHHVPRATPCSANMATEPATELTAETAAKRLDL